ncbi:MAG TPA: LysR family transcriptional regulator [Streptosporangiaceae bacterium]|jgi:hypothetical protein
MIAHTTNQRPGINHRRAEPVALPEAAGAPLAIELRHLRYFAAVADAGSFTHAAERMFVAQPTLSQQIRRLEEIIGTPLLQRRREGLRLTPAGSVLLDTRNPARADPAAQGHDHHPLTATAAVVWNGDLPRPLQQILFDAADGITSPDAVGTGEHEPAAVSQ